VSTPGPFDGTPSWLRDIIKSFHSEGPVNWDMARQLVHLSAGGTSSAENVDPIQRIRLEELVRVAEMHVVDATGLSTTTGGGLLRVRAVNRSEWALRALEDWKGVFEGLASSLGQAATPDAGPDDPDDPAGTADLTGFLGELGSVLGPFVMSAQIGGIATQLAERAFGEYDPPLPRPQSDEILLVPANIDAFAEDWSLPPDDVRLWVLVHEVAFHAVMGRAHVHQRLGSLVQEYVTGFEPNAAAFEDALGSIDPMNPESFKDALGDPRRLVGAMQTEHQREVKAKIEALTVPIVGFVDHVLETVGHRLVGSHGALDEALRRRRVEETEGSRLLGELLGVELTQAQYDRGAAFVKGVLERAGEDGLNRLWRSEHELPTPAEVGAPGLWLARIDLPGA
jgi:putative hydrolase